MYENIEEPNESMIEDNDDVFTGFGEGFEEDLESQAFINNEDKYEHDFAKADSSYENAW